MSLDKLETVYFEFDEIPKCIIMHPATFEKARREDFLAPTHNFSGDGKKFRGIKIYRSFDIKSDEIQMF